MKYYVELSTKQYGIEMGRLYPIHWDNRFNEPRVSFPRRLGMVGRLETWQDATGHVVEL